MWEGVSPSQGGDFEKMWVLNPVVCALDSIDQFSLKMYNNCSKRGGENLHRKSQSVAQSFKRMHYYIIYING